MECKLDKSLLQDMVEGIIEPGEKILLEEHLKLCKQCRRELTELKLLFWDLNNKDNYEIDIPKELDLLKDVVIKKTVQKQSLTPAGVLMEQQINTMKSSSKFLEFVPGIKQGGKLIKEGAKATPTALTKASKGLVKGAKKLIAK